MNQNFTFEKWIQLTFLMFYLKKFNFCVREQMIETRVKNIGKTINQAISLQIIETPFTVKNAIYQLIIIAVKAPSHLNHHESFFYFLMIIKLYIINAAIWIFIICFTFLFPATLWPLIEPHNLCKWIVCWLFAILHYGVVSLRAQMEFNYVLMMLDFIADTWRAWGSIFMMEKASIN